MALILTDFVRDINNINRVAEGGLYDYYIHYNPVVADGKSFDDEIKFRRDADNSGRINLTMHTTYSAEYVAWNRIHYDIRIYSTGDATVHETRRYPREETYYDISEGEFWSFYNQLKAIFDEYREIHPPPPPPSTTGLILPAILLGAGAVSYTLSKYLK